MGGKRTLGAIFDDIARMPLMRRLVAFLVGLVVLAGVNLLAPVIFPAVEYQSGNHEIATTIALGGAFLTSAIVYALYPRLRRGS
jgi:hypothetical protein